MAIPGLPGSLIIYQGHLFALKGHLWLPQPFSFLVFSGGFHSTHQKLVTFSGGFEGSPGKQGLSPLFAGLLGHMSRGRPRSL